MADFQLILLVLILAVDFVLSLWNAYAAGLTWAHVRNRPGQRFTKGCAVAGVGLAFTGISYVTLIGVAFAALLVGTLGPSDFLYLVDLDFLVFGLLLIGFGAVATAQSIAIAYRRRNFGALAVAAWNVFAEVWDLTIYAEGFRDAAAVVGRGDRNRINVYALVAVAVGIAFLLTYIAFRHGARRGEQAIAASPTQPPSDASGGSGEVPSRRHPLRVATLLGVVVVIVVVAGVIAFAYRPAPPQVQVTAIDVWAPTNVCGLGDQPIGYDGFTDAPGGADAFQLELPNFNTTDCTVRSVGTNSTGFGLSFVEVPVTVPGSERGTLNLTVNLPSDSFKGVLNLIYA